MQIPWIDDNTPLPAAQTAQTLDSALAGLVAASEGLSAQRLIEAYQKGIFPWFSEGQPVLWWSPDPRMVLQVRDFKLHRSLRKTLASFRHRNECTLRFDSAFDTVMELCAQSPRKGQTGTWIVANMMTAYQALHRMGFAHSVETWIEGKLVGGLYCVSIGDTLFGESMFSLRTDASKIALAGLVAFARSQGMRWIDCQQNTRHLASLGAKEVSRSEFLSWVEQAPKNTRRNWHFDASCWDHVLNQNAVQ